VISRIINKFKEHYHKVMRLPDSPKKIAGGVALGVALDFLPVPIISIPISFVLAKLIRVNAVASVLTVVFFKCAVPVFFYMNYMVGKLVLLDTAVSPAANGFHAMDILGWMDWVRHLGYPFLVGSFINASLAAVITYFIVSKLLIYRRRRKENIGPLKLSHHEKVR
jgi:uncharacterized protein (TIGR03546 family)